MDVFKTLVFDSNRPKADGTCNLKIKIEIRGIRKRKHYSLDLNFTPYHYDRVMNGQRNLTAQEKNDRKRIDDYLRKAQDIIDKLDVFSFEAFEEMFFGSRQIYSSVLYAFDEKIRDLKKEGKIGTAVVYECAKNSLNNFKKNLNFSDITPKFLKDYERWLLADGRSKTTVGMYLRNLRALFNSKDIDRKLYPFGKSETGKYQIPTSKNIKKALTLDEIAKIFNYEAKPGTWEERAKDYWIFLYLANGMNVKDFCLLKWENIKDGTIRYVREKTKETEKEAKPIVIDLKPQLMEIIKKHGVLSINKDAYIFPHIRPEMTPERQRKVYQGVTKMINKYINQIGLAVGIQKDVTTYVARHSFATILKRSGANVAMISELLGHSDISTTQNYLAGFEDDAIKKATDVLTIGFEKQAN